MFMGATGFEIAGGLTDSPSFVKDLDTERLGKGRVNLLSLKVFRFQLVALS